MRLQLSLILLSGFLFLSVPSIKAQTEISGDSVINFAHKYIDTPYQRGGSSPKAFDCSGFSSFVYRHFGYELNRSSRDQVKNGVEVNKNLLKPGDLVLFKGRNARANKIGHVGIVVEADSKGRFKFIHASTSQGVIINDGEQAYYKSRYVTARRILENDSENIFHESVKEPIPLFPLPANPIQLQIPSPYLSGVVGSPGIVVDMDNLPDFIPLRVPNVVSDYIQSRQNQPNYRDF